MEAAEIRRDGGAAARQECNAVGIGQRLELDRSIAWRTTAGFVRSDNGPQLYSAHKCRL